MKYFLFATLLLVSILSSCTVEKRLHTSGYYIDWKSWKRGPHKHEIATSPERNNVKKVTTKAIDSMDDVLTATVDTNPILLPATPAPHVIPVQKESSKSSPATLPEECDLIILTTGEEIKAKVIEIGVDEIRYKACDNLEGPTYVKYKRDVFMIKYPNGTNAVITPQNTPTYNNQLQYTGEKQIEILSLISFGMGLLGLGLVAVVGFPFLMGIGAIITGGIGLSKIKNQPGRWSGQGFAIAGIIIGSLVIILFWLLLIFALVLFATWGLFLFGG